MKHPYLLPLLEQLDENTQRTQQQLGHLDIDQLNWKPAPEVWSVGQCLDHLMVGNKQYFDLFKSLASQSYQPGLWAKISPFSTFFGNLLLQATDPQNAKKGKAPKVFQPSRSSLSPDVVHRFAEHQKELRGLIERMDMWGDHSVIIPSPASGALTYRLDTCIRILIQHETRHINQAERLLQHKDFPS